MPFTEVLTALQQKTIDGQENPVSMIYGGKLYEVQPYLTMPGHVRGPHVFLMNKKVFDSFSDADQKTILAAAKESLAFERSLNRWGKCTTCRRPEKGGSQGDGADSRVVQGISGRSRPRVCAV